MLDAEFELTELWEVCDVWAMLDAELELTSPGSHAGA